MDTSNVYIWCFISQIKLKSIDIFLLFVQEKIDQTKDVL